MYFVIVKFKYLLDNLPEDTKKWRFGRLATFLSSKCLEGKFQKREYNNISISSLTLCVCKLLCKM